MVTTTVGFGFEMFSGDLAGLAVKSFNLTGIRSGTIPPAPKVRPPLRLPRLPDPEPSR